MQTITSLAIPSAWNSKTLYRDKSWIYILTQNDIDEIHTALKIVVKRDLKPSEISQKTFPLPNFSETLKKVFEALEHNYGIFLIRGLPVQQYTVEENKLLWIGIGSYIGKLIKQNKPEELVYDVTDKGEYWRVVSAEGSTTGSPFLPFHTDQCDVAALLCLNKSKSGGESRVVSAVAIHNEIFTRRPDLLEILYKNFYYRRALWDGFSPGFFKLPIFEVYNGNFACYFARSYIDAGQTLKRVPKLSQLQSEALDLFEEIANDSNFYIETDFECGDMQFINNYITLHARGAYEDGSTPMTKRHLLRLWLSVENRRPVSRGFKSLMNN